MQKVLDFSPPFQQNENYAKKSEEKGKKKLALGWQYAILYKETNR